MSSNQELNQTAEIKLQSFNEFVTLIQDKQIEHALKLSKQTSITVGNRTYKKKPLTAKQWREISLLNTEMAKLPEGSIEQLDKLIELRTKASEYYFGISPEVFDENFEKLNPLIEGCILRSNTGLSPDIDLNALLHEYQKDGKKVSK
jgi:hypothetical protein